ncbi:hypothetical protein [Pedobacter sp.]|uniref:hypothetical protein n=1 Tax=Pedobacter sp. TaxID=1411316 RepID=UPI0031DDAD4F
MIKSIYLILLASITVNVYSQKKKALPILKSNKDTLDIRFDDYLDEQSWILSPKEKIDVLKLPIKDTPKKVTFISELDSISFTVKVGDTYDFFIFNGIKKYHTRIKGIPDYFTYKNDSLAEVNIQCLKTNLLSVAQRNKNYPFNKAKRIELISFIDPVTNFTTGLPAKNGKLDQAKIREQKTLNIDQINKLTDILFNIGRTPVPNLAYTMVDIGASCYEPRNGIVFFDSNNRVFEYVEICFGCRRSRVSSKRVKVGDECEQKHDILRDFFLEQGLKFGTVREEID